MFNTALIFIKPESTHAFKTVNKLINQLKSTSLKAKIVTTQEYIHFFKEHFTNTPTILFDEISAKKSIAFSIGGDGTFLFSVQKIASLNIPIAGIHQGNRGFLTLFMPQDIPQLIKDITNNKISTQKIPLWNAKVSNKNKDILFINEFILQRDASNKMIKYTFDIENLGSFDGRADGIIIASATGSTAYNLTAGGSIVHPDIQALSLTPICPHNLCHKTIIVPPYNIKLTLNNDTAGISFDGFSAGEIKANDTINISKTKNKITFIKPQNLEYLQHVSSKIF